MTVSPGSPLQRRTRRALGTRPVAIVLLVALAVPLAPRPADALPRPVEGIRAAEFILSLQNEHGAIRDSDTTSMANTDSQMEYALWGLAQAYVATGDARYLVAMRLGLQWLGSVQRRDGSWWFSYAADPPFAPDVSVAGVSSTIGLYIYDLWLYGTLSGDTAFVRSQMVRVRRGLRFLYERMRRKDDGTFISAFIRQLDGRYRRDLYRFTSDQADLYLGLRAAAALTGQPRFRKHAEQLKRMLKGTRFFVVKHGRYARGVDFRDRKDGRMEILTVWPNGYVPWVLGRYRNTRQALGFLARHQESDGGFRLWGSDPGYSLSAEVFVMGSHSVDGGESSRVVRASDWLTTMQDDPVTGSGTGGVADHRKRRQRFCNIAAFAVLSWFRAYPLIP